MNKELLKEICNTPGVPGFEFKVQNIVAGYFKKTCTSVTCDPVGNIIGFRKADKPAPKNKPPLKLMIAAHADEVGVMVKHINSNGMIHFIQVGGLNPQVAASQRVIIHGKEPVRGVIVPKLGKDEASPKLEDLLIDTGLSKNKLTKLVRPGDVATFEDDVSLLNDKMWVGRNFDDRIGTYCLVEAMNKVKSTCVDVYAVSSVQEEVGLRGARAAAGGICPDIGIAIDGSMARGAYVNERDNLCEPGEGTGIYVIDNLTIGHPALVQYLCDMCDKNKIPYQRNIGGGTDAAAMQQSPGGAIATTVGAPVRYMHSTVQLCHADDMDATVKLLVKFMETAHTFYAEL